jgi:hypothetical protein
MDSGLSRGWWGTNETALRLEGFARVPNISLTEHSEGIVFTPNYGVTMPSRLFGPSVLVVETDPRISVDLRAVGAEFGLKIFTARVTSEAKQVLTDAPIACAVLDGDLADSIAEQVRTLLAAASIPFIEYEGHSKLQSVASGVPTGFQVVAMQELVYTIFDLLPLDSEDS